MRVLLLALSAAVISLSLSLPVDGMGPFLNRMDLDDLSAYEASLKNNNDDLSPPDSVIPSTSPPSLGRSGSTSTNSSPTKSISLDDRIEWLVDFTDSHPQGIYCSRLEVYLTTEDFHLTSELLDKYYTTIRRRMFNEVKGSGGSPKPSPVLVASTIESDRTPIQLMAVSTFTDKNYGEFAHQVELGNLYMVRVRAHIINNSLKSMLNRNGNCRLHLACVQPNEPINNRLFPLDLRWIVSKRTEILARSEVFQLVKKKRNRVDDDDPPTYRGRVALNRVLPFLETGNHIEDLTPPKFYLNFLDIYYENCGEEIFTQTGHRRLLAFRLKYYNHLQAITESFFENAQNNVLGNFQIETGATRIGTKLLEMDNQISANENYNDNRKIQSQPKLRTEWRPKLEVIPESDSELE